MKKYGYYSLEASEKHGWCFYKTPSGKIVRVTSVGSKEKPSDSGYMWPDAICIGEVTEWHSGTTR